jgi:sulfite dehydrogenase (quinone) subunit SoeC
MKPAFSVIFLTTLIGAAQGLYLALYGAELAGFGSPAFGPEGRPQLAWGAVIAWVLSGLGLLASFFHLGHPERAWRAMAMWRTSWLSREVIALPLFMVALFFWGLAHWLGLPGTVWLGALAALLSIALYIITGMVYASIRFLQEWASPLTLVNYLLLGCASGFTLATLLATVLDMPGLMQPFGVAAMLTTVMAWVGRTASLVRNARLKPKSSTQSALGIKHPHIVQKAQGFMGGSFNTREFFHGQTAALLRSVKWVFLLLAFPLPLLCLTMALTSASMGWLVSAVVLQYLGLLAERWFFFAQANHPQNLYYQTIS